MIIVMNDHIRFGDSLMMLNAFKAAHSNTTMLPVYLSNISSN